MDVLFLSFVEPNQIYLLDSLDMWLEEVGETGSEGTEGISKGASLGSWVVRQDLSEKGGEISDKLSLEIVGNGVVGSCYKRETHYLICSKDHKRVSFYAN